MAGLSSAFRLLQTARNTAATGLTFALSIAVGVWFTPFLVGRIGPESYGLVMLAAVVVSYAGPVVQSLSTTLARAFAFAEAQDAAQAQRLTDDAMGLSLRIALVMALLIVPLALLGPRVLGISVTHRAEAASILALTGAAFVVWVLSSPFAAIMYCRNRLDLANYAQLLQTLLRVGGAVGLILLVGGQSWAIPAAGLAAAVGSLVFVWQVSRRISTLRFTYRRLFVPRIAGLARTGSSVLAGTVLTMLLLSSELLVVNYMANEAVAGSYAAAMQIPVLVRSAALGLAAIAGPAIQALYADGKIGAARSAAADAMKRIGLCIALPAGVALAIAPLILTLWLGSAFAPYAPVVWLGLIGAVFTTTAAPLYTLLVAADRTGLPAVFRGIGLALFLIAAVLLFRTTDLGVVSVAAGLCLGLILPEVAMMAPRTARATGGPVTQFLKPFAIAAVAVAVAWVLSSALAAVWMPRGIVDLCLFGAVVGIGHMAVCLVAFDRALLTRIGSAAGAALQRRRAPVARGSVE